MINFFLGIGLGVVLAVAAAAIAACCLSSQRSREEKEHETAAIFAQTGPGKLNAIQCGKWHLERLMAQGYMGAQELLHYVDGLERDNKALEGICAGLSQAITQLNESISGVRCQRCKQIVEEEHFDDHQNLRDTPAFTPGEG